MRSRPTIQTHAASTTSTGHLHTEVGYFPPFASQGGRDFQRNGQSIDEDGLRELPAGGRGGALEIEQRDAEFDRSFSTCPSWRRTRRCRRRRTSLKNYRGLDDNTEASRSRSDRTNLIASLTLQDSARGI